MVFLVLLSFAVQTADAFQKTAPRCYKMEIQPEWSEDGTQFWYQNHLGVDSWEIIFVDAKRGLRKSLVNTSEMKSHLQRIQMGFDEAQSCKFYGFSYDFDQQVCSFTFQQQSYVFDVEMNELKVSEPSDTERAKNDSGRLDDDNARSENSGEHTEITFVNRTKLLLTYSWINSSGQSVAYGSIKPEARNSQHTFSGHVWEITDSEGGYYGRFRGHPSPLPIEIHERVERKQRQASRTPRVSYQNSPDGKWQIQHDAGNLILRSAQGNETRSLTKDGHPENPYQFSGWSPDSQSLIATKVFPVEYENVYTLESAARQGYRGKLHEHRYALPGDEMTQYEWHLFNIETEDQHRLDLPIIDFGRPVIHWTSDQTFVVPKTDRGHQRFRLIECDTRTRKTRTIIDEKTDTFLWSAHGPSIPKTNFLKLSKELIYVSEQSGWRHLYLVNLEEPGSMQPITSGEWVVRKIESVDEETRQIIFAASGRHPDQDPYFLHHYRVNFDGTDLIELTEGNGSHSIEFSPDQRYLIDTYSRVDLPHVHNLRNAINGELICPLEEADNQELIEAGWKTPTAFHTTGRDGQTEIWGVICFPDNYDESKSYPILEDIYAGPHNYHVPKTFRQSRWYEQETEAGFIVVKIDGMGTAHRSKAFHDVCWQNLKDAGLPDRKLWIQAAANKYAGMDTSRVGIYGTSAGGQNAVSALLFHGDFYIAAVASCGCHDNRMDKASWNEQWMGYPVGPKYAASSNIDHAAKLEGNLLLMVGELDNNVPPESTYRLVDALIKADKEFDFLLLPGQGHTNGGSYGNRRRIQFFKEHLHP
ncbi:prolyl oligopeptidase family serine peptidase [Rubinisphaera sp.]|uniref:prolyl oligopeptidase family serine peptidase n=1 Tax=Rubinisphaera sp. TaxID=2024857 RepID=UPI0025D550D1|nr:prolyl oligopeptidase family serine peptidase [Rubinisphaera sp.]